MKDYFIKAFRSEPDGWALKLMSLPHIVIMAVVFALSIYVWKRRDYFNKHDILRKPLIVTLFLQFSILYSWYALSGYTGIRESLPLYNCRLAIILTCVALLTKNRLAQLIACYWGLAGGIIAVVLPSMDPFSWPHYTQISFFVGHLALLIGVLYVIAIDKPKFNLDSLRTMFFFSTIYHSVVAIIDYGLDTNYCYLKKFPFGDLPFVESNTISYTIFAILMHNFVLVLVHLSLKILAKKRDLHLISEEHGDVAEEDVREFRSH